MNKQNRGAGEPARGNRPAGEKKGAGSAAIVVPNYPDSRPLPAEKGPRGVEIREFASDAQWRDILSYYEKEMTGLGWAVFAHHYLDDRGTLSLRREPTETVTILAAREATDTHIRIYIQKK